MVNRFTSIRRKVSNTGSGTRWPGIYVDVCIDALGRINEICISEPGKFTDTALGDLLFQISDAINEIMGEINGRQSDDRNSND